MATSIRFKDGGLFTMLTAVTPSGTPLSVAMVEEEILETAGVDGRRFRTMFNQFRPFEIMTLQEAGTYDGAVIIARSYLASALKTRLVTLTVNGTSWPMVHIRDITPTAIPGQVIGPSAGSNSQASVLCRWVLEFTG